MTPELGSELGPGDGWDGSQDQRLDPAEGGPGSLGGPDVLEEELPLYFATVADFVEEFLAPTFGRDLTRQTITWCPEWWRHPEARYRLECLWRAWEHLRTDPALGGAKWVSEHLDHNLPILLDAMGPFKGCSPTKGHQTTDNTLPCDPAPRELFTTMMVE